MKRRDIVFIVIAIALFVVFLTSLHYTRDKSRLVLDCIGEVRPETFVLNLSTTTASTTDTTPIIVTSSDIYKAHFTCVPK